MAQGVFLTNPTQPNQMKETKEQEKKRHAKLEDLYACMEILVKWGYEDLAFDLRIEADKLRIYWK